MTTTSFIVALTVTGLPQILSAEPPADTPHLSFIELDFRDGIRIGYSIETGALVAIKTDGDTVTDIGLATFDKDGGLIFARAGLSGIDEVLELAVGDQSVMLVDDQGEMLTIDPHIVGVELVEKRLSEAVSMTVKIFGGTLQFKTTSVDGTPVDLIKVDIAGRTYGLFSAADTVFVAPMMTSGDSLVVLDAPTAIAVVESGAVTEHVSVSALSAFGIGVSQQPAVAAGTTAQPPVVMDVVAA